MMNRFATATACMAATLAAASLLSACRHVSSPAYQRGEKRRQEFIARVKGFVPKDQLSGIAPAFFTGRGSRDFCRFPLAYPYEIGMVDQVDEGSLDERLPDRSDSHIWGITHCAFDGEVLIGKKEDGWFRFMFASGRTVPLAGMEEAKADAVERELIEPGGEIPTVAEQYRWFSNDW